MFAVLASTDPNKACSTDYVTAHYLSVAYGGKQGCVQAQAPASAPKSLNMNDVILLDTAKPPPQASVRVAPDGGLYNGEQLLVSLVKEDGTWKIDELKSNAPVGP